MRRTNFFFSKIDNCRNLYAKSCYAEFLNMHVGSTGKINSKSTHQIMDFFVLQLINWQCKDYYCPKISSVLCTSARQSFGLSFPFPSAVSVVLSELRVLLSFSKFSAFMCDPDESNYHYLPILLLFFSFLLIGKNTSLYISLSSLRRLERESGKAQNDTNGPF